LTTRSVVLVNLWFVHHLFGWRGAHFWEIEEAYRNTFFAFFLLDSIEKYPSCPWARQHASFTAIIIMQNICVIDCNCTSKKYWEQNLCFSRKWGFFSLKMSIFSQNGELFADLRTKVLILREKNTHFREKDWFFSRDFLQCVEYVVSILGQTWQHAVVHRSSCVNLTYKVIGS